MIYQNVTFLLRRSLIIHEMVAGTLPRQYYPGSIVGHRDAAGYPTGLESAESTSSTSMRDLSETVIIVSRAVHYQTLVTGVA